jgi:hypothetical protein
MRFVVGLVAVLALGCTKENPHACGDGTCNDPQFPFCDTRGTLGGAVNECVAVTCTPGVFAECRGDTSVVCDATGENYELQQCVRGCDDETGGCHIDPSNDLGQYYDMVPDPPDLELVSGTIDTHAGTINGENTIPNFLVPAPPGGVAIRVFVARHVRLVDVVIAVSSADAPALALLATEDIAIESSVAFSHSPYRAAGSVDLDADDSCRGGDAVIAGAGDKSAASGLGGGGYGTPGGAGGNVIAGSSSFAGGNGGGVVGIDTVIPLRGGCGSSLSSGRGGGAMQLTSMKMIRVVGLIDVSGQGGGTQSADVGGYTTSLVSGGGAGGGILLEAPLVELGSQSRLLAKGGAGASREHDGGASTNQYPNPGGQCSDGTCGAGGDGAIAGTDAGAGQSVTFDGSASVTAGGGGGGLGRLRINTADGTYMKSATTIEVAVTTSGVIRRR